MWWSVAVVVSLTAAWLGAIYVVWVAMLVWEAYDTYEVQSNLDPHIEAIAGMYDRAVRKRLEEVIDADRRGHA